MSSPSVILLLTFNFEVVVLELKMSNLNCGQKKTGTKGSNGQWCSYQSVLCLR